MQLSLGANRLVRELEALVDVFVSGAVTAPAAGAVIVDTGALAFGEYELVYNLSVSDTVAVGKEMVVELRNGANTATLAVFGACPGAFALHVREPRFSVGGGERVRVISGVAGAANSRYKATLQLRVAP